MLPAQRTAVKHGARRNSLFRATCCSSACDSSARQLQQLEHQQQLLLRAAARLFCWWQQQGRRRRGSGPGWRVASAAGSTAPRGRSGWPQCLDGRQPEALALGSCSGAAGTWHCAVLGAQQSQQQTSAQQGSSMACHAQHAPSTHTCSRLSARVRMHACMLSSWATQRTSCRKAGVWSAGQHMLPSALPWASVDCPKALSKV